MEAIRRSHRRGPSHASHGRVVSLARWMAQRRPVEPSWRPRHPNLQLGYPRRQPNLPNLPNQLRNLQTRREELMRRRLVRIQARLTGPTMPRETLMVPMRRRVTQRAPRGPTQMESIVSRRHLANEIAPLAIRSANLRSLHRRRSCTLPRGLRGCPTSRASLPAPSPCTLSLHPRAFPHVSPPPHAYPICGTFLVLLRWHRGPRT